MLQLLDIDAARHDVGGDETAVPAGLEPLERLGPLRLRPVPVDLGVGDSLFHEIIGQAIGAMLGPREDDHVADVPAAHQLNEQRWLEFFPHGVEGLANTDRRRGLSLQIDRRRVVQQFPRERLDRPRHGSREEECLALRR